jgi:alpha-L-fucosidase
MTHAKDTKQDNKTTGEEMDAMWGDTASTPHEHPGAQWFRDLKYSMFIHWGLYSHIGGRWKGKTYYGIGEWMMSRSMADIPVDDYKKVASDFNPANFDAHAVVRPCEECRHALHRGDSQAS